MKTKSTLENKIKLFLIKSQIKRDLIQFNLMERLEAAMALKGQMFVPVDPYGEENWEE